MPAGMLVPVITWPTERLAVVPELRRTSVLPRRASGKAVAAVVTAIWKSPRISRSAIEVPEFRLSEPPRRKWAVPVALPQIGLAKPVQSTTRRSLAAEKPA